MKCNFCGRSTGVFKKMSPAIIEDMNFKQFKKIFDSLKEIMHVSFCGIGEPFLNNALFEMIKYSKKNGKLVILSTNGILLDNTTVENILRIKVDDIGISIKESKKEFFSKVTGLEDKYFDLIVANVANLVEKRNQAKSNMRIRLSYVCSRDNVQAMKDMIELANSLQVDTLIFQGLTVPNLMAENNLKKLFFHNDRRLAEEFTELLSKAKIKVILPSLIEKDCKGKQCFFVNCAISVDATGNVSPCCGIPPQKKFGNIFFDNNVLNNKSFIFIRKLLAHKPLYSCLRCAFLSDRNA